MSSFVYTYGGIKTGQNTVYFFPISPHLNSDKEFGGIYIVDTIYQHVNKYDIVFFNYERQAWAPAMANNIKTMPARGVALDSEYGGGTIRILLYGAVYNPDWNFNLDKQIIYLSHDDLGKVSTDMVQRTKFYRQPIGLIQNPHQIFFRFTGLWMCNLKDDF